MGMLLSLVMRTLTGNGDATHRECVSSTGMRMFLTGNGDVNLTVDAHPHQEWGFVLPAMHIFTGNTDRGCKLPVIQSVNCMKFVKANRPFSARLDFLAFKKYVVTSSSLDIAVNTGKATKTFKFLVQRHLKSQLTYLSCKECCRQFLPCVLLIKRF